MHAANTNDTLSWTIVDGPVVTHYETGKRKPLIIVDRSHGLTLDPRWGQVIWAAEQDVLHFSYLDKLEECLCEGMDPTDALLYLAAEALEALGDQTGLLLADLLPPAEVVRVDLGLLNRGAK